MSNSITKKKLFALESSNNAGGSVVSVNSGTDITIDNTDPANPIVNFTGTYQDPITVVANYSALPAVGTVTGEFYWCSASQGTSWLPGSLGGTYYNSGLYYSNGVTWEYLDVPYQATQATVNTGTNTDQFITPSTLTNATVITNKELLANKMATNGYPAQIAYDIILQDNSTGSIFSILRSIASVTRTWIFPDKNGTVAMTNDAAMTDARNTKMVLGQNTTSSHTGDTNETVLYTATLTGGSIGLNGILEMFTLVGRTGTAGNITIRMKLGGTTIGTLTLLTANTTVGMQRFFWNKNSESSNQSINSTTSLTTMFQNHTANVTTFAIDTSVNKTFEITVQLVNAADTASLYIATLNIIK